MAYRLTANRIAALRQAVAHPKGSVHAMTPASDQTALEGLGCAASIDDCGDVLTSDGPTSPDDPHRSHPHFLRVTDTGRDALAAYDRAQAEKGQQR
ncbi:hypothetical protein ACIHCQ_42265 [Streptomyces sp. NPDC052236]|uniref:hypothetical protein n=1 Tax=Streptomyces sp. NPDC052236 TaxID=3365686 RepID=UPI0037CFC5CB